MNRRIHVRKVSGPPDEPISLADARIFLRQDVPGYSGDTLQDTLLQTWISAARKVCEDELDQRIGAQQFLASMPGFLSARYGPPVYVFSSMMGAYVAADYFAEDYCASADSGSGSANSIRLPSGPVRSVESIRWRLDGSSYNVMDPATYQVTQVLRNLAPIYGTAWPVAGYMEDAVLIDYTVGMSYPGDTDVGVESIQHDIIAAMRLLLGHFWFNRTAVVQVLSRGSGLVELPMGVKQLLWPNRASIGI